MRKIRETSGLPGMGRLTMTHVPIIGGGPAGMSCALWLANYGLNPVIVEREGALGGMARRNPYPNPWLLGRPDALARENAAEFARHIEAVGVETWLGCRPRRAERRADGGFRLDLVFSDRRPPRSLSCPILVIATGTEFRGEDWLDSVPGARELAAKGRVHLGPAWAGEPTAELGARVALIGGGDNAFDVAQLLSRKGVAVTIVMRSRTPRAQPLLVERALASPGPVSVRAQQTVAALADLGASVRVRLSGGSDLEVDHLVLLFGYQPNSGDPWLSELAPATDANGYLCVDGNMETSCPGIFAVGDVANPRHPCTATAIAAGTMAAREIGKRLTRST